MKSNKLRVLVGGLVALSVATGCGSDEGAESQAREVGVSEATTTASVEAGQWVKWRVVYDDDTQIVMTVRAEEKEGEHTWFDVQQVSEAYGDLHFRMLGTPGTIDRPTGYIKEIEGSWDSGSGSAEDFMNAWLEESAAEQIMSLMAQETFSTAVRDDEPVVVAAGTFHGCYKTSASVGMESGDVEVTVWRHPEVPFSGFVLGTDDAGTYRMEVLDYGN